MAITSAKRLFTLILPCWLMLQGTAAGQEPTTSDVSEEATAPPPAPETPPPDPDFQVVHEIDESMGEEISVEIDPSETAGFDNGFFIRDSAANFSMRLSLRLQTQFLFRDSEVVGEDRENSYAFMLRRARLKIGGFLFNHSFQYLFQLAFDQGDIHLADFFFDFRTHRGHRLRVGQVKVPANREFMTSAFRLVLVDRSITNHFYAPTRDIGVFAHSSLSVHQRFEWALGLFNGSGASPTLSGDVVSAPGDPAIVIDDVSSTTFPDHFDPGVAVRLGYNHGIRGYAQGDLEGGPFRFAVAVSGRADFDTANESDGSVRGEFDYALAAQGFSSTGGLFAVWQQDGSKWTDQGLDWRGFFVQASYVFDQWLQLAARYALVAPVGPNNDKQELTAGVSFYVRGRSLKWQIDGSWLPSDTEQGRLDDFRTRTQFTLDF